MNRKQTYCANTKDHGDKPPFEGERGLAIQRARQLRAAKMKFVREQDLPPIAGDCSSFLRECYRFAGFESKDPGRMNTGILGGNQAVDRMLALGFELTETPCPGDVIVLNWQGSPSHFGLITEYYGENDLDFIHLSHTVGFVVETPLAAQWMDRLNCFLTLPQWPQKESSCPQKLEPTLGPPPQSTRMLPPLGLSKRSLPKLTRS